MLYGLVVIFIGQNENDFFPSSLLIKIAAAVGANMCFDVAVDIKCFNVRVDVKKLLY